jgi:hypothetical protein
VPDAVSWQRRTAPQRRAGVPVQMNPGQHPSPATVMRMLDEHDQKAAAAG